jgi:hypothetical protein
VVALFVALGAIAFAHSDRASAHFNSGEWSHVGSSCSYTDTRQDPVNLIFYGSGYADRAADSINYHFGWSNAGGGTQYFASHGNCLPHTHDPASSGSPRYHVRIKKTWDGDPGGWEVTAAAAPHYERNVDCTWGPFGTDHAVYGTPSVTWSGYVEGRQRIIDGLYFREGHYFWGYQWWNNTEPRVNQCNNDYAWGDGYVGFIHQHYSFHG